MNFNRLIKSFQFTKPTAIPKKRCVFSKKRQKEMANAAAKKAAKVGDQTYRKYLPYAIISNLLYIGFKIFWKYSSTTFWSYFFLFFFNLIYIISIYGLIQTAQNKIQNEIYFDSFCVNCFSQIISSFTDKGRLILLLIPGYFIYLGIGWYLAFKKKTPETNQDISNNTDDNTNTNNKNNEQQKSEKKVKTKVIRR